MYHSFLIKGKHCLIRTSLDFTGLWIRPKEHQLLIILVGTVPDRSNLLIRVTVCIRVGHTVSTSFILIQCFQCLLEGSLHNFSVTLPIIGRTPMRFFHPLCSYITIFFGTLPFVPFGVTLKISSRLQSLYLWLFSCSAGINSRCSAVTWF